MKTGTTATVLPYPSKRRAGAGFAALRRRFEAVDPAWTNHGAHEALFDALEDLGGLPACPPAIREELVLWMARCYLGEPGGYGAFGHGRKVFYSDSAAPRIEALFRAHGPLLREELERVCEDRLVRRAARDEWVARRLDALRSLAAPPAGE